MFKRKLVIIAGVLVFVATMAITTLAVIGNSRQTGRFAKNGYVLFSDENGILCKAIINQGDKYQAIYPSKVEFKDVQNANKKITSDSFIYYDNGSIGCFSDGVLLNANEVGSSYINNYSLPKNTYLEKIDEGYKIKNTSGEINFNDIVLKVSDDKYIMIADTLSLHLGESSVETVESFIEVEYVDQGVVQIISKNNIWNTISSQAKIVLDDGVEFDLAEKKLINKNNDGSLYLANLLVENDDNIDLHYLETMGVGKITVPVFDIETSDGKKGEVGKSGKTGEGGESGSAGAAGSAGVAGAAGASGEDGDTVGTGTVIETVEEPVFTVSEWNVTPETIYGNISIEDEDFSLVTDSTGSIKVIKSGSAVAAETIGSIDFSSCVGSGYEFNFESLEPDQEYQFILEADYTSADGEEYRRVFLDRVFYTSSLGAFAEPSVVYEDSVRVSIRKQIYSTAKSARVYLLTEEENNSFSPSLADSYKREEIVFQTDDGQDESLVTTFTNLESNTNYIVRIVVDYQNDDGVILTKTSNAQEEFTTLKQRAEFTYTDPVVLLQNPQTASLDTAIKANSIKDTDGGITKYIYTLYSYEDGVYTEVKKRAVETKDSVQFLLGGDIITGKEYAVGLEVEFFDNEKTQIIKAPAKSNIASIITATYPTVTFDLETVDEYNEIGGTLTVHNLNAKWEENSRIKVTYSIAGNYEKTIHYAENPIEGEEAFPNDWVDDEMKISVSLDGVKSGSQMYISVWGSYDLDLDGYYSEILIGTIVKDIVEPRNLQANWAVDENGSNSLNASMYLTVLGDDDEPLSTDEAKASTEAKTMGQMVIEIYEGNNLSQPIGSVRYTNTNDDKKNSSFVKHFDPATPIEINETTLNVAGINTSANYTLKVKEVTDYTVITEEENKSGYVNTFTVEQDSFTMEVNNLPPPLENSPITAVAILNSDARMYGGTVDESLEDNTIVGYYLSTKYDNYAELATDITYYAFDAVDYESFVPSGSDTDPIEADREISGLTIDLGDTDPLELPGMVMFFGNDPDTGAATDEGNLKSLTNGSKVAYIGENFVRGWQFIFAYQVGYEKNEVSYVYPNDYVSNYSMKDVLRTGTNNARKQEPEFSFIPWISDGNRFTYKYLYTDVDECIESLDMLWEIEGTSGDGSEALGEANVWNEVEFGGTTYPLIEDVSTAVSITTSPYNYAGSDEQKTILVTPYEDIQSDTFLDYLDFVMRPELDNNRIYFDVVKKDANTTNEEMEEYLTKLAGLKIVFERNGVEKTVYKDLYDIISYVADWYTYTIVQTSELGSIIDETGDTTIDIYPIYDSGVSGFDIQAGELYALQKVKATSPFTFEEYQIRNDGSWSIMNSVNGSIFSLDDFSPGDGTLGVNSIVGDESIPEITIAQDRYGLKGDGEQANTFMPKKLAVSDSAKQDVITEHIQLTPALVVYRSSDIQRYLNRITMDYRVQGQTSTEKVEFRIYEGSIVNGQIAYNEDAEDVVTIDVDQAEGNVYSVEFVDLIEETYYKISAYAVLDDDSKVLMLDGARNKTDMIEYAEYETSTLSETGITNLTLDYIAETYNNKYYSLSYDLDTILGYDIKYAIYDFDELGNVNENPIYDHEDMIAEGIIDELPDDYVYSESETQRFRMFYDDYQEGEIWADKILRDGSEYQIKITAISKNDQSVLGEADVNFISHPPQSPSYFITSKPEYDSDTDEYSLQIKVTVSDVSKVIAGYPLQAGYSGNGYYKIKIFKAADNGEGEITYETDVTPQDIDGRIFDIDRRRTFDLDNAQADTGYMVNIYAVHDMDGTSDINIDNIVESELINYKVATDIEYTLGSTSYSLGEYYASAQGADETKIRVNFIDATGLDTITEIQYSYVSKDGSISSGSTIVNPVFVDRGDGVLSIDLESDVVAGERYYITMSFYTDDNEQGETISMTYDLN